MVKVLFSAAARRDISALWQWYAKRGGIDLADAIVDRIEQRIFALTRFPDIGPPRPDIATTARVLVVHRWLVLYEVRGADARIVRIVDGAIDLKREIWNERP